MTGGGPPAAVSGPRPAPGPGRASAALLGFCEILIWLLALGQVMQNLDRPLNYLAYAGGFAAGTWVGLALESRVALGMLAVQVITREDASSLVERLRDGDFGVTVVGARGLTGRARLIYSVIRRRDLRRLLSAVRESHPRAFLSVSDVRLASEGYFGPSSITSPWWGGRIGKK